VDPILWTLAVAAFLAVVGWVLAPLRETLAHRLEPLRDGPGAERRALRERKAALLGALRDLDFDYETGKLSADDYRSLRESATARAVEVLKRLETMDAEWQRVQQEVDAELARRKKAPAAPAVASGTRAACASCGAPRREADRFCPQCGTPAARACRSCGRSLPGGERFCGGCGAPTEAANARP
jgi:RNA polymerase subunit RPABC4/transcription elongation factor Spt4